jgi:hypothetical protein
VASIEPLLQHYGLRTRWVDVVDNIWVALWFACHDLTVRGRHGHHIRRQPDTELNPLAYISVLDLGQCIPTGQAGIQRSDHARFVDLRQAVPSIYLRPHAQHGMLVSAPSWSANTEHDLIDRVMVTLEIPLRSALEWLGSGVSLTPYVLFPPATHDEGFRRILEYTPAPPTGLGDFVQFGPGW